VAGATFVGRDLVLACR
jgi:hypothetical protein